MEFDLKVSSIVDKKGKAEDAKPAGYLALIEGLSAAAPQPDTLSYVSFGKPRADRGRKYAERDGLALYERSYQPSDTFEGHLNFAMRHETLDLLALKRIFDKTPSEVMEAYVRAAPTGSVRRQAWFLFERLTGRVLDLPDAPLCNSVDAIDDKVWHTAKPILSARHRVRDNLLGVAGMCSLVRRDATLGQPTKDYVADRLSALIKNQPVSVTNRLTRRLLLKDSRSTFAIERETPGAERMQKWSDLVARAGEEKLSLDRLLKLQEILLSDKRWVAKGIRHGGVWLGDRIDGSPVPNWIGAKPEDLRGLLARYFEAAERMEESGCDPLVAATINHSTWINLHPFEDGNGRTARYILQHGLARGGVGVDGVVLPVSKAIWADVDGYHDALRSFDIPRMPLMDWTPTHNGNVEVTNSTDDLYRYGDLTKHVAFMSRCLLRTLDHEIPNELREMRQRDAAIDQIRDIVEMPDDKIERLIAYVRQNGGRLSKAKRKRDFELMAGDEIAAAEEVICDVYSIEAEEAAPTAEIADELAVARAM